MLTKKNTPHMDVTVKIVLSLSILIFLINPHQAQSNSIQALNPISHWTCDEASGVRYDSTASNNDLTDNNTVTSATGLLGNACDFEKSNNEYLSITDASQTGLDLGSANDFTWSVWSNIESSIPTGEEYGFFFKWVGGTNNRTTYWFLDYSGSSYRIGLNQSTLGTTANYSSYSGNISTINSSTWYHYVFTYERTSQVFKFWRNGQWVNTQYTGQSSLYNSSAPVQIGSGFDGLQDEITVFNTALSTSTILSLYNNGTPLQYEEPILDAPDLNATWSMYPLQTATCSQLGSTTSCVYDYATSTDLTTTDFLNLTLFFLIGLGLAVFLIKKLT